MSRPLTIGERQKLRTTEQRLASRKKGEATRRANKLASERHYEYAEGYQAGWDAALQANEPRTLRAFLARWWKR